MQLREYNCRVFDEYGFKRGRFSYRIAYQKVNMWVQPRLLVDPCYWSFYFLCCPVMCFAFWVPWFDVRCDFYMKAMFSSSFFLSLVACNREGVMSCLWCLCTYGGVQHGLYCVFVLFVFVLRAMYCRFLWIFHFDCPFCIL